MTFTELKIAPPILKALDQAHYKHPTPIQVQAIPPALAGRDLLGCAQTGTGKTAAFAVPTLQRLMQNSRPEKRRIRSLILTPTRELALQIHESLIPMVDTRASVPASFLAASHRSSRKSSCARVSTSSSQHRAVSWTC